MTFEEVQAIINRITIPDRKFRLIDKYEGDGFLLQLEYFDKDIITGKPELQRARKWYVSPFMTESEVVETAFAAYERSQRHIACETFLYQGQRVYSPHFDVKARLEACRSKGFDWRDKGA